MKRKELKEWVKLYKQCDFEEKAQLVGHLLHTLVNEFQMASSKTPSQVLGVVQASNIWWKDFARMVPAMKDDLLLSLTNYQEALAQVLDHHTVGSDLAPQMFSKLGWDWGKAVRPSEYIEVQFIEG